MEQVYNIYKIQDNKSLVEINKVEFEGKTYTLFVSNEAPYSACVGEILEGNNINLVQDKDLATKIIKEISKDEATIEKFKPLLKKIV